MANRWEGQADEKCWSGKDQIEKVLLQPRLDYKRSFINTKDILDSLRFGVESRRRIMDGLKPNLRQGLVIKLLKVNEWIEKI